MEKKKLCLIYNYAQHYRKGIFEKIDNEFDCNFIFGDKYLDVKKIDYSIFKNKVYEVNNKKIGPFICQYNIFKHIKLNYRTFLVLGETRNLTTWLLLIYGKLFNKDVYVWSHGMFGKENWIKKNVNKFFYYLCKGGFIYNNYSRDIMIKNGINKDKLFVIYNSLDYNSHLKIRGNLKEDDIYEKHFLNGGKNIIFVGRLTKVKKLEMLIEVIKKSKNENQNINLTFIGDGEQKNMLENLSKKYNLVNNVWFYGECYDEKILANLIYNADLCVSPGNVGLTSIHALSFGCPVITHNEFKYQMPEFEAIHEGLTGTFFIYNNQDSLYLTITEWLNNNKDRNLIRNCAFKIIDKKWNPNYQIDLFKKVIYRD